MFKGGRLKVGRKKVKGSGSIDVLQMLLQILFIAVDIILRGGKMLYRLSRFTELNLNSFVLYLKIL